MQAPDGVHPVILCGGSGTRLWPVSRKAYPKQFAPLISDQSLYQMTLARFAAEGFAAPLVMTGDAFRFLATDQAADLGLRTHAWWSSRSAVTRRRPS
jgi:mannose-1-phosphate guanylyltransferase/mannose-6-phosphate isomerase